MIKRPSGLSRHYTDTTLHQYECGEYSALAAWWITNQGLNDDHPVYIVTLITKHWCHTVCEVKGKGTFDGKNNLFLPDYYYHAGPATNDQFWNADVAFDWLEFQYKAKWIEQFYLYNPDEVMKKNLILVGDHVVFKE